MIIVVSGEVVERDGKEPKGQEDFDLSPEDDDVTAFAHEHHPPLGFGQ